MDFLSQDRSVVETKQANRGQQKWDDQEYRWLLQVVKRALVSVLFVTQSVCVCQAAVTQACRAPAATPGACA